MKNLSFLMFSLAIVFVAGIYIGESYMERVAYDQGFEAGKINLDLRIRESYGKCPQDKITNCYERYFFRPHNANKVFDPNWYDVAITKNGYTMTETEDVWRFQPKINSKTMSKEPPIDSGTITIKSSFLITPEDQERYKQDSEQAAKRWAENPQWFSPELRKLLQKMST